MVVPLFTEHQASSAASSLVAGLRPRVDRLESLTTFRFFAALWVLAFHLAGRVPLAFPDPLRHLISNGAYAMSFFFVLSGAVLAYGYADLSPNTGGVMRFYIARLARIYPAYILTYLLAVPWLGISLTDDWVRWAFVTATSVFGIQAWFPHSFVGANTGLWSLSCEFFFYALFPALLPLALRLGSRDNFARAVTYLMLFIGFLGMTDFAFASKGTFPIYYISPALRLPEFFLGMVLGVALRRRPDTPPGSVLGPNLAALGVLIASMNSVHEVGLWMRANIIVVPALAWLIYSTASVELSHAGRPNRVAWQLWRFFRYLGEISYCFFLAQLPLLLWYDSVRVSGAPWARWAENSAVVAWCTAVAVTLLGSIVLHEGVEKPVRRRLMRLVPAARSASS